MSRRSKTVSIAVSAACCGAGVGAIIGGIVLAALPGGNAVSRTVDVQVSPGRVTVGRTFGF